MNTNGLAVLENEQSHWVLDTVKDGTFIMGTVTAIPWFIHLISSLPFVADGVAKYKDWAARSIRQRLSAKPSQKGTLGCLLQDARERLGERGVELEWNGLIGDMMAMVNGGTEPVVVAMVYLFYYLA